MAHRTIIPEHGTQEHIIVEEFSDGRVVVACGHDHFNINELETRRYSEPITWDNDSGDDELCWNCVDQVTKLAQVPKRY